MRCQASVCWQTPRGDIAITRMMNNNSWHMCQKRVERIWRRKGLKVPQKQPKTGRPWLDDGSSVRLPPERPNHLGSYDVVQDRAHDGRVFRPLDIFDAFTKGALMIRPKRMLTYARPEKRTNRSVAPIIGNHLA